MDLSRSTLQISVPLNIGLVENCLCANMGETSLNDSNVKVAVRVRPMNRRGEKPNLKSLFINGIIRQNFIDDMVRMRRTLSGTIKGACFVPLLPMLYF